MGAKVLCTAPSVTLNRRHWVHILVKSVKMHGNLTLEQNRHFSLAPRATFGPWLWMVGPMGAMVLCATPSVTLNRCQRGPILVKSWKSVFGAKQTFFSCSKSNVWALVVEGGSHGCYDFVYSTFSNFKQAS